MCFFIIVSKSVPKDSVEKLRVRGDTLQVRTPKTEWFRLRPLGLKRNCMGVVTRKKGEKSKEDETAVPSCKGSDVRQVGFRHNTEGKLREFQQHP